MSKTTWDPSTFGPLTSDQRKFIVQHEKLHLEYAARRGKISPEARANFEKQLDAFLMGEKSEPAEYEVKPRTVLVTGWQDLFRNSIVASHQERAKPTVLLVHPDESGRFGKAEMQKGLAEIAAVLEEKK